LRRDREDRVRPLEVAASEQLGDLTAFKGALAEIVGDAPEREAVVDGRSSRTRLTKWYVTDALDRRT
jgi:hypothetical protein